MANEADKNEAENDEAEVKEKKGLSTMKIVILAVVFASLISGGMVGLSLYLLGGDDPKAVATAGEEGEGEEGEFEEEPEKLEPAHYHPIDPKFIVSFSDQRVARFMQFSLKIMTRDKNIIDQINTHKPPIRSNLLLLFDGQEAEVMKTREGKEALLQMITDDINKSLEELAGVSGVEAAYFDSFLLQ